MGKVSERRFASRQLALDLIQQADKLMYDAKGSRAGHVYVIEMKVANGQLVELATDRPQPTTRPVIAAESPRPHA